ncbi:CPBP family intramembrane metalloprotease [Halobacteria archaeon AArc-m2/3/4]|uniref:CPBP family intramembrane metalloprotease n=1 Tax=Natronoglomus mannanivorans TaxID=2979990 RepID=A0ABT2QGA6_9EURY|nr:CPBP family intramembrane metalloprotease [Halobacteria archaeon AArc-m2/3/4]
MDPTTSSRGHRFGSVGAFVAGREALTFFALTLALSWAVWLPGALGFVEFGSFTLAVIVIGGFGPLVAAALVTWLVGDSLRVWAGQLRRWRVHYSWYLAAFVVPVVIFAASIGVYSALGNPVEQAEALQQIPIYVLPLIFVLNMVFVFLLGGGQEELGWRGFALPRLLDRFNAVTASLIIGAVWALWHLPLFVMEGSSQFNQPFVPYATSLLALSIVFTWLYRGTGCSVLLAMILHASYNSATVLIPFQPVQTGAMSWLLAAVIWVLALGLVAIHGRDLCSSDPMDRETGEDRSPPAA